MKQLILLLLNTAIANCVLAQGLTKYGEVTSTGTEYINRHGAPATGTGINKNGQLVTTLNVGDNYQGGIIAYVLAPEDPGYDPNVLHGIIAAESDLTGTWGCWGVSISGADGTAIGTGNQNTIDIMAGCGTAGIHARICGDLVLNGYTDWYLPSKDELYKLYLNKALIGGFTATWYYSSSEYSNNFAWRQEFDTGLQVGQDSWKDYTGIHVRPVRSF